MSALVYYAFWWTTYATGTHRCEILLLNERPTEIVAAKQSPSGSHLLAHVGPVATATLIVFEGDRRTILQMPSPAWLPPWLSTYIDDKGKVFVNYQFGGGSSARIWTYELTTKGARPLTPPTEDEGKPRIVYDQNGRPSVQGRIGGWHFEARGLAGGGALLGQMKGPFDLNDTINDEANVLWRGGRRVILWRGKTLPFARPMIEVAAGVLGAIPLVRSMGLTASATTTRPVLYRINGEATLLPLPDRREAGFPTAATPDGSLAFGVADGPGGPPAAVVWVEGVPRFLPSGKRTIVSAEIRSVAHDGRIAVGGAPQNSSSDAIVWTPKLGIVTLQHFARVEGIDLPFGWKLQEAVGVDPSGNLVFGTVIDQKGKRRPFRLWLNERPISKTEKSGSGDRT